MLGQHKLLFTFLAYTLAITLNLYNAKDKMYDTLINILKKLAVKIQFWEKLLQKKKHYT